MEFHFLRWLLRLIPAIVLFQTLFFKFSAHPESVAIFEKLHSEPSGRIGVGILELIAIILLIFPKTTRFGSLLTFGLMSGAFVFHLTLLGIETNGDGGLLFGLCIVSLIASFINILSEKEQLKRDFRKMRKGE